MEYSKNIVRARQKKVVTFIILIPAVRARRLPFESKLITEVRLLLLMAHLVLHQNIQEHCHKLRIFLA